MAAFGPSVGSAGSRSVTIIPSPLLIAGQFRELGIGIKSLREPLKQAIQEVFAPAFQRNFDDEGPGWEPLAEATVSKKQAAGNGNGILVESGRLKRVAGQLNIWSINGGYSSGSAEAFVNDLPGAEYGSFHQSGTSHMPAREFLTINESDMNKIEQVFDNYLDTRLARAGFV